MKSLMLTCHEPKSKPVPCADAWQRCERMLTMLLLERFNTRLRKNMVRFTVAIFAYNKYKGYTQKKNEIKEIAEKIKAGKTSDQIRRGPPYNTNTAYNSRHGGESTQKKVIRTWNNQRYTAAEEAKTPPTNRCVLSSHACSSYEFLIGLQLSKTMEAAMLQAETAVAAKESIPCLPLSQGWGACACAA